MLPVTQIRGLSTSWKEVFQRFPLLPRFWAIIYIVFVEKYVNEASRSVVLFSMLLCQNL